MRAALWLVLAGCFKPTYHDGLACASDGWCPPPQSCGRDGFCHLVAPPDGTSDTGDGQLPVSANYAFVTSQQRPLYMFANVGELDAWCGTLAAAVNKPGTYVAWFSTSTRNAIDLLAGVPGWVRVDGETFATSAQDIVAGKIYAPLRIDETGFDQYGAAVATSTASDGTYATGPNCFGSMTSTAVVHGSAHAGKPWWTYNTDGAVGCSTPTRYYCFEVDKQAAAPLPAHTGKRAFLSVGSINGGQGLAAMDNLCKTEAGASNFVALVGSGDGSTGNLFYAASDRLSMNMVRPDGVLFTNSNNIIVAPLDVTLGKAYVDVPVWAGTRISYNAPTSSNDDCNGWADATSGHSAVESASSQTLDDTFGLTGGSNTCNNTRRLYCVEQ